MHWYPVKPLPGGRPGGALFRRLMGHPAWHAEAKVDGVRAVWTDGALWSSTGRRVPRVPGAVLEGLELLPWDVAIDAELAGDTLWCFDLPDGVGDLDDRRRALARILRGAGPSLRLTPLGDWLDVGRLGWEGLVLKRRSSLYERATRPGVTTANWLKFRRAWLS